MTDLEKFEAATVSAEELASWLGISVDRVFQIARDGTAVRKGRGKYALAESVRRYMRRIEKHADTVTGGEDAEYNPAQEGARLAARKSEVLEMQIAKMRSDLMPMSDMIEVCEVVVQRAEAGGERLVRMLRERLSDLTEKEHSIIADDIRRIVAELRQDMAGVEAQAVALALEGT